MNFKGKLSRADIEGPAIENATVSLRRVSAPGGIEAWEGTLTVPAPAMLHPFVEYVLATDDGRTLHLTAVGSAPGSRIRVELNGNMQ